VVDPKIRQKIAIVSAEPATTWKSDGLLDAPVLTSPNDGSTICPYMTFGSSNSEIVLTWNAVTGATKYVLQWSLNSNFVGPTTKSVKQAGTSYNLQLISDIRMGDEISWRVQAIDEAGSFSELSQTRTVTYDCEPGQASGGGDSQPSGGKSGDQKCKLFNVKMKLQGLADMLCQDKTSYKLNTEWDCKDSTGREIATLDGVAWSIVQDPDEAIPAVTIKQSTDLKATLETNGTQSQQFELVAKATFTDNVNGGQFVCTEKKEIHLDCDVKPNQKPWLQNMYLCHDGYALESIDPIMHDDPELDLAIWPGLSLPSVVDMGIISYSSSGQFYGGAMISETYYGDVASVLAAGPTVQVSYTFSEEYTCGSKSNYSSYTPIPMGPRKLVKLESRAIMQFGCGFTVLGEELGLVTINNEHLVGRAGTRRGLEAVETCSLGINYGSGLTITNEVLEMKLDECPDGPFSAVVWSSAIPTYVLGLDSDGCLKKFSVYDCS